MIINIDKCISEIYTDKIITLDHFNPSFEDVYYPNITENKIVKYKSQYALCNVPLFLQFGDKTNTKCIDNKHYFYVELPRTMDILTNMHIECNNIECNNNNDAELVFDDHVCSNIPISTITIPMCNLSFTPVYLRVPVSEQDQFITITITFDVYILPHDLRMDTRKQTVINNAGVTFDSGKVLLNIN